MPAVAVASGCRVVHRDRGRRHPVQTRHEHEMVISPSPSTTARSEMDRARGTTGVGSDRRVGSGIDGVWGPGSTGGAGIHGCGVRIDRCGVRGVDRCGVGVHRCGGSTGSTGESGPPVWGRVDRRGVGIDRCGVHTGVGSGSTGVGSGSTGAGAGAAIVTVTGTGLVVSQKLRGILCRAPEPRRCPSRRCRRVPHHAVW